MNENELTTDFVDKPQVGQLYRLNSLPHYEVLAIGVNPSNTQEEYVTYREAEGSKVFVERVEDFIATKNRALWSQKKIMEKQFQERFGKG